MKIIIANSSMYSKYKYFREQLKSALEAMTLVQGGEKHSYL